ncbi:FAD-dependent oxidoreductase [Proteiniborus sp. MB09-C3]|uniref:flavin monoamine oxidase family protein n=1 Tax=Proteiniborus sp. MB09-C3 TaxID=3050072 RepID=UPI002552F86F|nr:FAD-dependent oxidoreductase [Proteiniborus sp. MB09-C3]WIV12254.1 FAD-dependent oxidoreductase [Proteiniborus sp. MB09-C3]
MFLHKDNVNNPTNLERYSIMEELLINSRRDPRELPGIVNALSPPADITSIAKPGTFKNKKVAIIGAGAAGLSAAFQLRKLGFDITIFEARENRVGGRIYTYYFNSENYGELGAMRIPVSHETTWHYINLLGLNTRPFVQVNPNAFIYVKNTRVRNDPEGENVKREIYPKFRMKNWERQLSWTELLGYAMDTPLLEMSPELRIELLHIRKITNSVINYWDYFNHRQVMEKLGLSSGAINMLNSVSPFTRLLLYYSYIETAMENSSLSSSIMYEIVGGNSLLPLALYKSLTSPNPKEYTGIEAKDLGKIDIRMGTWVEGICRLEQRNKVGIIHNNKKNLGAKKEDFDYVVCAIPFSTLRNVDINPLFSNRKMEAIMEVNYTLAQKTLLFCNKRFWQEQGIMGGGSFTDLPISTLWYPSDGKSTAQPGVFIASYNLELDAIRFGNLPRFLKLEELKNQVERVHGLPYGYLDRVVIDWKYLNWHDESWSLGAFCYFLPEQRRLFLYAMGVPEYNNKVFFAGEHVSVTHGWMNGALQTGMKAANDLAIEAVCHSEPSHKGNSN